MQVRRPAVAGMFYESSPDRLRAQLENCFMGNLGPGTIPEVAQSALEGLAGLVVPHAGLMYSGCAAAHSYAVLASHGRPDLAVIVGPNHTGYGEPLAVMTGGVWKTPLGEVEIDGEAAHELIRLCPEVADSPPAHLSEHCLEVQLPFLQYLYGDRFRLLPLVLGVHPMSKEAGPVAELLGAALAEMMAGRSAVLQKREEKKRMD